MASPSPPSIVGPVYSQQDDNSRHARYISALTGSEENKVSHSVLSVVLESSVELRLDWVQPASSHLELKRCVESLRQVGCDSCSTCCTGSIPGQLGNLSALQSLHLSANELTGTSNVCLGVSDVCRVVWWPYLKRNP